MTGFARATGPDPSRAWTWELRSVNGRGLEVRSRFPGGLDHLEPAVRAAVAKRLARGNVSVTLTLSQAEAGARLRLNRAALDDVLAIVRELHGRIDVAAPRIDGLLALRGVLEAAEETKLPDEPSLLAGLDKGLAELARVRDEEGGRLETLMAGHLDQIEQLTRNAAACAGAQPAAIKARLQSKLDELLGGSPALPPERLAQEAALLATRADVREEIDRLNAHVAAARALFREGGAIGRKLDFLSQEFNREANTLCSKSDDMELTRIGLDLKAVIERMREQAANIE